MSVSVSTVKSQPPASLPPESAPNPPFRPAAPSQLALAEHAVHRFVYTVPIGVEADNVLRHDYWQNLCDRLRPHDTIEVHDAAGRYFMELFVRQVTPRRLMSGAAGGAIVFPLRRIEFEPLDNRPTPPTHGVKFLGPAQGWCVIRFHDQKVVVENLSDRGEAEKHATMLMRA